MINIIITTITSSSCQNGGFDEYVCIGTIGGIYLYSVDGVYGRVSRFFFDNIVRNICADDCGC